MFKTCGAIVNLTNNSKSYELEVSVIIPVYNEERYIMSCIDSILGQDFIKINEAGLCNTEIIFIDNGSLDSTVEILNKYIKEVNFFKLIKNSVNSISVSLNMGIKNALGKYIVRIDAHSVYSFDYITKCIYFLKLTNSQNVGGPMIAKGKTKIQKIIAAAYQNKFALGGGKNHNDNYKGYAETVYLGCFEREYLVKIGMYDESLNGSEDDELNFRINLNGGKIYITPEIKSVYYPRDTFKSLFKQYFYYGFYKVFFIKKYKKIIKIVHFIPALFVLFIFISLISFLLNFYSFFFIVMLVIYLVVSLYFSMFNNELVKLLDKFILFLVHFIIHFSYGLGFLKGFFSVNKKKIKTLNLDGEELKKLQQKGLTIFNHFQDFCKKNNLFFFICGGCCIGALRNEGFIPWDDDIDIFMPRYDYERFKLLWNNNSKYSCVIPLLDKISYPFIKMVDNNTTLIRKEDVFKKNSMGVAIDIFPLDGCPKSFFKRGFQILCALIYCLYSSETLPEKHGVVVDLFARLLLKLPSIKMKKKIALYCEKNMSKYDIKECDNITELCAGPKYMFNKYSKKIFSSFVLKKFENQFIPIPIGYDEYLKKAFGFYMDIPPKEQRKTDHDVVFMNLEKSQKNKVFEILNNINN